MLKKDKNPMNDPLEATAQPTEVPDTEKSIIQCNLICCGILPARVLFS